MGRASGQKVRCPVASGITSRFSYVFFMRLEVQVAHTSHNEKKLSFFVMFWQFWHKKRKKYPPESWRSHRVWRRSLPPCCQPSMGHGMDTDTMDTRLLLVTPCDSKSAARAFRKWSLNWQAMRTMQTMQTMQRMNIDIGTLEESLGTHPFSLKQKLISDSFTGLVNK